jgi:hypothetical protein
MGATLRRRATNNTPLSVHGQEAYKKSLIYSSIKENQRLFVFLWKERQ